MLIFTVADKHTDDRRTLVAFRPTSDFPDVAESKMLTTHRAGVTLGNHSHPHNEGFFLVAGSCQVVTWMPDKGREEFELRAPVMFMFEANEEHRLICGDAGMTLIGYMPVTYEDENNAPAAHLDHCLVHPSIL